MHTELDVHGYVEDLERHLRLVLFGDHGPDADGAVLLVRGALASGDRSKAALLAEATRQLAAVNPGDPEVAAAARHTRGLIADDPAALENAAMGYSSAHSRAWALEDAGVAWAETGDLDKAEDLLRQAYTLYEEAGAAGGMDRVRSFLRGIGIRMRNWHSADRPAFGWDSLTDTERRIAELVGQGLSNREVASRIFLSRHTVAFHLRNVFWKLGITSRVQLARVAAGKA
jgi:DNA-binding CsgD family transcriptional regulator